MQFHWLYGTFEKCFSNLPRTAAVVVAASAATVTASSAVVAAATAAAAHSAESVSTEIETSASEAR